MSVKTPAVAFITAKVRRTPRTAMREIIHEAPIRAKDMDFLQDCIAGMSYKDLAEKYSKSQARVCQWKRKVYEQLFCYMKAEGLK